MLKMAVCEYETTYNSHRTLVSQGWEGGITQEAGSRQLLFFKFNKQSASPWVYSHRSEEEEKGGSA